MWAGLLLCLVTVYLCADPQGCIHWLKLSAMFPCPKNTSSISVLPAGQLLWSAATSVDAALKKRTNTSEAVLSCSFTLSARSLTFSSQDTGWGFLCLPHRIVTIKTSESLPSPSDGAVLGGLSWFRAAQLWFSSALVQLSPSL